MQSVKTRFECEVDRLEQIPALREAEIGDTANAFETLMDTFRVSGKPVEVDFRSMVSWIKTGDQLTHQIHPYPAKLLPNIGHFFVRASTLAPKGARVLDPFCGSGTVALEASLAGHEATVADANPLAILITRVKTTPFNPQKLEHEALEIHRKCRRLKTAASLPVVNSDFWFGKRIKQEIEILARAIDEVASNSTRNFFRVCLSATARRLSRADPAISVPVRLRAKPTFSEARNSTIRSHIRRVSTALVADEFLGLCESNIYRVRQTNEVCPSRGKAKVVGADARDLAISGKDSSRLVDLIVTSPPYGNAQKYIRASSLSLNILGLTSPEHLRELEERSIGREHVWDFDDSDEEALPKESRTFLSKVKKKNPHRAVLTERYLTELRQSLHEMYRVLRPGGHAVIVIGNNSVCGETLRNDNFVSGVFESIGMARRLSLIDHIRSRGLMTKRNRTASTISRECVLVFRKEK